MRLLNTDTHALEDFSTRPKKPEYAILSHRWTDSEISFQEIVHDGQSRPSGIHRMKTSPKIQGAVEKAHELGLKYLWVDTFCIDKTSSAELTEAINSMYKWYQGAKCCFVYLQDVNGVQYLHSFRQSEWFLRGWTLQELLAPPVVHFYDREWKFIGDKANLATPVSSITGISSEALTTGDLRNYSVAQKMSWASVRTTTRPQDRAYSLLGIFGINMPLLYGEGDKAFMRLQEEIIKEYDDHSIFAWHMSSSEPTGILAPDPFYFRDSREAVPATVSDHQSPFSMTNRGLSIHFELTP